MKHELSRLRENQLEEQYFRKNESIRDRIQDRLKRIVEMEH